jgi:hypothetical protein
VPTIPTVPAKTTLAGLPTEAPTTPVNQICEDTNRLSLANGGLATADTMTNPDLALKEQFCLARAFTMAKGEARLDTVQGMTVEDVRNECAALATTLAPAISGLSGGIAPPATLAEVKAASGQMTNEAMSTYGEVCLGLGFGDDRPDVSLAAALFMTAAGHPSYAELVGHHLRGGHGVAGDEAAARAWYDMALSASDAGATPEILPGQFVERYAVLRAGLNGAAGAGLVNTGLGNSGLANTGLANQIVPLSSN